MPRRLHAVAALAWALVALFGCGERAQTSSGAASASASASPAAPLATMGPSGQLVYRDGRALIGTTNLTEIREAALVRVTRSKVLLEDVPVDDTASLADGARLHRAEGLFDALRRRREDAHREHPNATPSDVVILDVDEDVPATAVKSVFQTCAYAGYPNTLFLVARGDAGPNEAPGR